MSLISRLSDASSDNALQASLSYGSKVFIPTGYRVLYPNEVPTIGDYVAYRAGNFGEFQWLPVGYRQYANALFYRGIVFCRLISTDKVPTI